MAYEAMLAGLDMAPFRGGFKVKNLEPNAVRDSMTCFYKLLEHLPFRIIKWEVHSESHLPLLTSDEPPPRRFSRSVLSFLTCPSFSKQGY